ncbi:hypothetical protein AVEN_195950-1, partial [Araneus ventricosus]
MLYGFFRVMQQESETNDMNAKKYKAMTGFDLLGGMLGFCDALPPNPK